VAGKVVALDNSNLPSCCRDTIRHQLRDQLAVVHDMVGSKSYCMPALLDCCLSLLLLALLRIRAVHLRERTVASMMGSASSEDSIVRY